MKKIIMFLQIIFSASVLSVQAQVILSTNGNFETFQGGSITWTLGEPIIETIDNGNNELTQGFQQTDLWSKQLITIPQGWSYISSFLVPNNSDIENLMQDLVTGSNLVILASTGGIYAPPPLWINTLGTWNSYSGYKVKMNAQDELSIRGDLTYSTIDFPAGLHLVPVLTNVESAIADVFENPENDILYFLDIYTSQVYWPNGGIFTLSGLTPGKGYLANFKNPVTMTFPAYNNNGKSTIKQEQIPSEGPWHFTRTTDFHLISINVNAMKELDEIDYVGAFNSSGKCAGYARLDRSGSNVLLTVFADDPLTASKDGATEGEHLTFRGFSTASGEEIRLQPEFSEDFTNHDGLFAFYGLSGITKFGAVSSGDVDPDLAQQLKLYPNPAADHVTIEYPSNGQLVNISLTSPEGRVILTLETYDDLNVMNIRDIRPGMYILHLETHDKQINKMLIVY